MPCMEKSTADDNIVKQILKLAENPEKAENTESAYYGQMSLGVTKDDVCDAICNWINSGEQVQRITTKDAKGHIGERPFVMKPVLAGKKCYVKVTVQKSGSAKERLLIISTHSDV